MCKVLENRAQQDEERMDQLTNQLKEARLLAEDADGKSDEVRTLALDNFYLQKGEESSLGIFKIRELGNKLLIIYKFVISRIPDTLFEGYRDAEHQYGISCNYILEKHSRSSE